ncbi:CocE/NonD family hydrolase [Uliginosibacterium sp. H3]|uniref:CocE/NonD family hydrolase n=1 Tax=Uliginosibacterium silvisoli TaxID=3114758 RepID=A0ABU6K9C8_9RHOO|nr:CocE/NonD family hydrolase [Uliginosibacterium sp. H3]
MPDLLVVSVLRSVRAWAVMSFVLALVCASSALCAAEDRYDERNLIPFRQYQIVTYVYRPEKEAATFPIVIFSHGRATTAEARGRVDQPARSIIDFWLKRGFAVVAAVRPGYGATGGGDREVSGSRWVEGPDRTLICEGRGDFQAVAEKSAEAVSKVIEWTRAQPWADRSRILLLGQSVGGLTTVALTSKQIEGVVGAINFSGGTGGEPVRSPGMSCKPEAIAALYRAYGAKASVPSLWLYSRNDQFWGEAAPRDWYAAFSEGGSDTRFFQAPALPNRDGHQLLLHGANYWMPEVDAFLRKLGVMRTDP